MKSVSMYGRKVLPLFFVISLVWQNIGFAETAVIRVNFRDASELLPVVETFLSEHGRATVDVRTNSILLLDDPATLNKVRQLVNRLDRPAEQVTIRFRFQETGISKGDHLSASGKASGEKWTVSAGKTRKEGVHVRAGARRKEVARSTESLITVISGNAAYIRVGEGIPYTERWVALCRRYARTQREADLERIETGMEVTPVVTGDRVQLEILPRISHGKMKKGGVIRFLEASTTLSVPKGKWITLGGHKEGGNEVIREILSRRSAEDQTRISLSLMVVD